MLYDQWYKNRQKPVSFSGHISDRLSMVLVSAGQHNGYATERVRHSIKAWLQGAGKIWSSMQVTGSAERNPRGDIPLPLAN